MIWLSKIEVVMGFVPVSSQEYYLRNSEWDDFCDLNNLLLILLDELRGVFMLKTKSIGLFLILLYLFVCAFFLSF